MAATAEQRIALISFDIMRSNVAIASIFDAQIGAVVQRALEAAVDRLFQEAAKGETGNRIPTSDSGQDVR